MNSTEGRGIFFVILKKNKEMLGLKLLTDPSWVTIVEENIDEILTDHAWCEQKAATNAISLIVQNPERTEMVEALLEIAQEELAHFDQVHQLIKARGKSLGRERKDEYVNELYHFMERGKDRNTAFIDRLLFSAMIEARSCERLEFFPKTFLIKPLLNFTMI
jgi:tRNA-(ms[2]io[6]A)-hydroxylase